MSCGNCGHPRVKAKGLCGTCHQYELRNEQPRPEELIVRHGRRILERRLSRG